ncbi:BA75_04858T0 [Komagataella pastoris]|uniref:BA75_04858T0 n=1 Tax=Komagataella pastoris TaxID=4922 RepID=A0A1B2JJ13_PICPA|nr:BA75_04858T0 [Komagataella pastoris]
MNNDFPPDTMMGSFRFENPAQSQQQQQQQQQRQQGQGHQITSLPNQQFPQQQQHPPPHGHPYYGLPPPGQAPLYNGTTLPQSYATPPTFNGGFADLSGHNFQPSVIQGNVPLLNHQGSFQGSSMQNPIEIIERQRFEQQQQQQLHQQKSQQPQQDHLQSHYQGQSVNGPESLRPLDFYYPKSQTTSVVNKRPIQPEVIDLVSKKPKQENKAPSSSTLYPPFKLWLDQYRVKQRVQYSENELKILLLKLGRDNEKSKTIQFLAGIFNEMTAVDYKYKAILVDNIFSYFPWAKENKHDLVKVYMKVASWLINSFKAKEEDAVKTYLEFFRKASLTPEMISIFKLDKVLAKIEKSKNFGEPLKVIVRQISASLSVDKPKSSNGSLNTSASSTTVKPNTFKGFSSLSKAAVAPANKAKKPTVFVRDNTTGASNAENTKNSSSSASSSTSPPPTASSKTITQPTKKASGGWSLSDYITKSKSTAESANEPRSSSQPPEEKEKDDKVNPDGNTLGLVSILKKPNQLKSKKKEGVRFNDANLVQIKHIVPEWILTGETYNHSEFDLKEGSALKSLNHIQQEDASPPKDEALPTSAPALMELPPPNEYIVTVNDLHTYKLEVYDLKQLENYEEELKINPTSRGGEAAVPGQEVESQLYDDAKAFSDSVLQATPTEPDSVISERADASITKTISAFC